MGGSHVERTDPVLPNSMRKSWLLVTTLDGWVSLLGSIFFMSSRSVSTRAITVLLLVRKATKMGLKINTDHNF